MLARAPTPVGAAAGARRAALPALPALRGARLRVRAIVPEGRDKPGDATGGEPPKRDLSDVPPPGRPSAVGEAVREATPRSAPAFETFWLFPTFSRRHEVFAGRMAMLGLAATCAWEVLLPSHPGPIGLTSMLTGWSLPSVKLLYAAFVAHGAAGLLWPGSPTFDPRNQQDIAQRPRGPPNTVVNPIMNPAKFLGCSTYFGFTKKNELFNGRMAMLGFFAAVVNEGVAGLGPIGQLAWWPSVGSTLDANNDYYRMFGMGLVAFAVAMAGISYATGHAATTQGEDDIY